MTFIKRLFGRKPKQAVEPLHGSAPRRNPDLDHSPDRGTRSRMEAEVAADRERRGATDERPGDSNQ
jgi:hypothetical protein